MRATLIVTLLAVSAACGSTAKNDEMAKSTFGAQATFDVTHRLDVTVPDGAKEVQVWFTRPQQDPAQTVSNFKVNAPFRWSTAKDSEGNTYIYVDVKNPTEKTFTIENTFTVTRHEVRSGVTAAGTRPLTAQDLQGKEKYLEANEHVVIDDNMRKLASEIVGNEKNPVTASKHIYDWVLNNIDYWVKDPENKKASPVGSSEYCLTSRTGNCTDFHSLYMSLSRAAGIPTRITYGSLFKTELDGTDQDQSYHCWIEFYAPSYGWVPLDVAVADIFVGDFTLTETNAAKVRLTTADGYTKADPAKVEYYFGNLDNRRVSWSRGRDLQLTEPKVAGAPINAIPKAYIVVDGQPSGEYARKLTFTERSGS